MSKRTFDWTGVEYQSPEYYRLWRKHNAEKSRAYHRMYDRLMYAKNPERENARRKHWALMNANKVKAHRAVAHAIKTGKLIKKSCVTCRRKAVAHHDDYNKPLDVVWLCEVHHKARHRAIDL